MCKSQIYKKLRVENYYYIYLLCNKSEKKGEGSGLALVGFAVENRKELKTSTVSFIWKWIYWINFENLPGRKLGFIELGNLKNKLQ